MWGKRERRVRERERESAFEKANIPSPDLSLLARQRFELRQLIKKIFFSFLARPTSSWIFRSPKQKHETHSTVFENWTLCEFQGAWSNWKKNKTPGFKDPQERCIGGIRWTSNACDCSLRAKKGYIPGILHTPNTEISKVTGFALLPLSRFALKRAMFSLGYFCVRMNCSPKNWGMHKALKNRISCSWSFVFTF